MVKTQQRCKLSYFNNEKNRTAHVPFAAEPYMQPQTGRALYMGAKRMLSLVNPRMLAREMSHGDTPVLVAFLRKGPAFSEQIRTLENLSEAYSHHLKVLLGDEYFLEIFFQQFGFSGTPFYLLIGNGKAQGRYFGRAAADDLEELVRDYDMEHE